MRGTTVYGVSDCCDCSLDSPGHVPLFLFLGVVVGWVDGWMGMSVIMKGYESASKQAS